MYIADTLSRAYLTEPPTKSDRKLSNDIEVTVHTVLHETSVSNKTLEEIREATSADATLTELRALIANGFLSETSSLSSELKAYQKLVTDMHEVDGVLVHNNKVIISLSLRPKMLSIIHEGHLGMEKCKSLARQSLYWPGLTRDIEELIGKCSTCNSYRRKQQQESLIPHPVPHRPWQKLGADIFSLKNKDYLLIVDYYSKYPEISMLHDKTASSVITSMKSVFARHGVPDEIMADNMPFASKDMTTFAKDWNFNIIISSPHYAQSNGQAKRTIQTVKSLLKKAMDSACDPYVPLLQYRNAQLSDFNKSPAELLFNRPLTTKLPVMPNALLSTESDRDTRLCLQQRQRQKFYYDRGTRNLSPLQSGDVVRVNHNK